MKSGKKEVIFDDEELIFNCGNFLISVKCSVLISSFIPDLFLISNFKEEADNKDGGAKEDEVIEYNSGEIDITWQPAKARELVKNGEETDEEDDEENAIEVEIETN